MSKNRKMIGFSPLKRREMKNIMKTNDYRKLFKMIMDTKNENNICRAENIKLREELEHRRETLSKYKCIIISPVAN